MSNLFIVVIASASIPDTLLHDLGMGYVAISFAIVALLQHKATADRFYREIDWDLLAFFAALFIVINVMEHAQVLHLVGRFLAPILNMGETVGPGVLLVASAAASSVRGWVRPSPSCTPPPPRHRCHALRAS